MPHSDRLQDAFLETLKKQNLQVSIFLINGIKLHGIVDQFDDHVVMLKNAVTQMVYKHAISTVVPAHMLKISIDDAEE
jgi:host factor-I protein